MPCTFDEAKGSVVLGDPGRLRAREGHVNAEGRSSGHFGVFIYMFYFLFLRVPHVLILEVVQIVFSSIFREQSLR